MNTLQQQKEFTQNIKDYGLVLMYQFKVIAEKLKFEHYYYALVPRN